MDRLHGAIRSMSAVARPTGMPDLPIADVDRPPWWDPGRTRASTRRTTRSSSTASSLRRGVQVRLRPGAKRADAQDMFLEGRLAHVEAVLNDVDGQTHLAVALDDLVEDGFNPHGRFLYFAPDEVEPVGGRVMRTLVAGLGNIFHGDDGVGVAVVQALAAEPLPDGVDGERLRHPRRAPGLRTARRVRPRRHRRRGAARRAAGHGARDRACRDPKRRTAARPLMDAHDMAPDEVLALVPALGGTLGRVVVVGCEIASAEACAELTAAVRTAVPALVPRGAAHRPRGTRHRRQQEVDDEEAVPARTGRPVARWWRSTCRTSSAT